MGPITTTSLTARGLVPLTVVTKGSAEFVHGAEGVVGREIALDHLDRFTRFVSDATGGAALADVRRGITLLHDGTRPGAAQALVGRITMGPAGDGFLRSPLESPGVLGHESLHAIRDYRAVPIDELAGDLVGIAFARSGGAAPEDWRIGHDVTTEHVRDLRSPKYPTVASIDPHEPDPHVVGGPITAALARAADRLGVETVDRAMVAGVAGDLGRHAPRWSYDTGFLERQSRRTPAHLVMHHANLSDVAASISDAAARQADVGSPATRVLLDEFRASGIDMGG